MLQSLREETEGKLQMLLSPRKNSLDSLFEEVRVVKVANRIDFPDTPDAEETRGCLLDSGFFEFLG